jgi:hypothetical protein
MFHPADTPMQRGWVGRLDGDEVVHLASQTLQHLFTGGGTAREHARYSLADVTLLLPLPSPPSVRVFADERSFEFANPAALAGPGAVVTPPTDTPVVADVGVAGLVGLDAVVALVPVARLRATALAPPKDRDFGIVLGSFFTTTDEAPAASTARIGIGGSTHESRVAQLDWEAAMSFAGENTRLRVGDLFVAPPAVTVDVPAGSEVTLALEGLGDLRFSLDPGANAG